MKMSRADLLAEAYEEAENHLRACADEETEDMPQKAAYNEVAARLRRTGLRVYDRERAKE
jgi:hypothetical protein